MIRYKISKDINSINLWKEWPPHNSHGEQIHIRFDHYRYVYLCDIVEINDKWKMSKIKIFMPNGEIVIGWQAPMWIELHHSGNMFDGRFNSDSDIWGNK